MNKKIVIALFVAIALCLIGWKTLHDFPEEKRYKVFILWSGLGEYGWAKRLENGCNRLKWQSKLCCSAQSLDSYHQLIMENTLSPAVIQAQIEEFRPDFILSLKDQSIFSTNFPNYLAITGTFANYFDNYFKPTAHMLQFDAFLYASPAIKNLNFFIEASGKKLQGMDWYPSATATKYDPVIPQKVFFCGFQWDQKRNGSEFRKMFQLLDEKGNLTIYGPANRWDFVPNAVKGFTFDENELRQGMRDAGIVLILNSSSNLILGTPAARIFEAAAASTVIISDLHPFIIREFGDSVLYVNQNETGQALYRQINAHLEWILSHPQEAQAIAKKANAIFNEKFTIEKQLKELGMLHERVKLQQINSTRISCF